jgi:hypothetical protein
MKRGITTVLLPIICIEIFSQVYKNQIINPNINTLQAYPSNNVVNMPVLELGTNQTLIVSFDEMSFKSKTFYYKIIHCDKNFSKSLLSENEYINGFFYGKIDDVELSQNTITNYANYRFEIPNANYSFKVSGNYAAVIAEDNDFSSPDAVILFYVVENHVNIKAKITANTNIEFNGRYQQLEFEIDNLNYQIQNVFSELDVNVFQNRRIDNAAYNIKPTFTTLNKQTYTKNPNLIFEGGNQYRTIDFASEYAFSGEIDKIEVRTDYYNVFLMPAFARNTYSSPTSGYDADGNYIINRRDYDNVDFNADYMWVHFVLPAKVPFFNGDMHLLENINFNYLNNSTKMEYNTELKIYHKSLFLKQGGYSFLYAFVPKGSSKAELSSFEGSYWQTENEYSIFVYHRPFGGRFDKLIGVKIIKNE